MPPEKCVPKMNDPHVSALHYRVCHNESVDYSKAKPLVFDQPCFRVEVKDKKARFELKQHCESEDEARKLIDPYVKNWEFDASLKHQPGYFRLEFDRAEIIDRSPIKGVVVLRLLPIKVRAEISSPKLLVHPPTFPTPPSAIDSDHPDVQTLHQRYKAFCQGKEPLTAFAYFCLTMMESSVRLGKRRRQRAADKYEIDLQVLNEVAKLSSNKGGREARKASASGDPLTQAERQFLKRAVVRLILRVAEYHGGGTEGLRKITTQEINGEV